MMNETPHYDAIIVGGRPAGSTLAARLALEGLRVLILERAVMPSLPGVSSPIIYASTMNMLDEIGADENAYARNTPKIRRFLNVMDDDVYQFDIPDMDGRDYAYAVDRARFDGALWDHALSFPTVDGYDQFSVTDLLWDDAQTRVIGVVGQGADRVKRTFTADVVIGADGRFSMVARKVNAAEVDEHDDYPTTLYYAYWKNAAQFRDGLPSAVAVGRGEGIGFLMMDSADDTIVIAVEGKSDLLEPQPGQAEALYLEMLREYPVIWKRVQYAERITDVRGMKKVGNMYRQPGGDGWALVGDAYHQKDPIDGQGIYDAVFTAKTLAAEIGAWKRGDKSWADALTAYDTLARAETFAMYKSTMDRVRSSVYAQLPKWALDVAKKTWMRWIFEDTLVQQQLGLMMTRQVRAEDAVSPPIFIGALLRGPLRDLSRALAKSIER